MLLASSLLRTVSPVKLFNNFITFNSKSVPRECDYSKASKLRNYRNVRSLWVRGRGKGKWGSPTSPESPPYCKTTTCGRFRRLKNGRVDHYPRPASLETSGICLIVLFFFVVITHQSTWRCTYYSVVQEVYQS